MKRFIQHPLWSSSSVCRTVLMPLRNYATRSACDHQTTRGKSEKLHKRKKESTTNNIDSPLLRWSSTMGQKWKQRATGSPATTSKSASTSSPCFSSLPVDVVLEGCRSAFNATNAMRVTLYFNTSRPPIFVGIESLEDIASLNRRKNNQKSQDGAGTTSSGETAEDGGKEEEDFAPYISRFVPDVNALEQQPPAAAGASFCTSGLPVAATASQVSMECYVKGAQDMNTKHLFTAVNASSSSVQSEMSTAAAAGFNLVMGDENKGVSADALSSSGLIVYLPQYGTISSLNVVTCMGIGLFYSFVDYSRCCFQQGTRIPLRRLLSPSSSQSTCSNSAEDDGAPSNAAAYASIFSKPLPGCDFSSADTANTTDAPQQWDTRSANSGERVDPRPVHPLFYGLKSVSDIQQRHTEVIKEMFTLPSTSGEDEERPFRLSLFYENDIDRRNLGGMVRNANAYWVDKVYFCGSRSINTKGTVGCNHYTDIVHLGRLMGDDGRKKPELAMQVAETLQAIMVEKELEMWFLSCAHEALYTVEEQETLRRIRHEARQRNGGQEVDLFLDGDETVLAAAAKQPGGGDGSQKIKKKKGLILLVPQEGVLPSEHFLRLCSRHVHVTRQGMVNIDDATTPLTAPHCGLPSQVASGIALQRLFTVTNWSLIEKVHKGSVSCSTDTTVVKG